MQPLEITNTKNTKTRKTHNHLSAIRHRQTFGGGDNFPKHCIAQQSRAHTTPKLGRPAQQNLPSGLLTSPSFVGTPAQLSTVSWRYGILP